MINGKLIHDTDGNVIHAHGGWVLEHGGYYYWYGEDRRSNYYVSCYRSKDLKTWERRGAVLTTKSRIDEDSFPDRKHLLINTDGRKVNIERPKVVYDEKSERFIMWAHYENGNDYLDAMACTAVSDTPDGEFTYLGAFRPCGCMSRDCTVFTDPESGRTYFMSASNENRDMHVYLLTENLLDVEKQVNNLFIGGLREAPAVFFKDGKYYMISSYCTGWAPNQGKWSCADSIEGLWSGLKDFGDKTTYDSQSAFILNHNGEYYYVGDRWKGGIPKYFRSTYVVLKIQFNDNNEPFIEYSDTCEIM